MNIHDLIDIPIFIVLVIICIVIFLMEILFLNHILYDTYTVFVVGVQFNKYKIKNFINIYDTPQLKCVKLGRYWLKMHNTIFKVNKISRCTLQIIHKLSNTAFCITTGPKKGKKCIKIKKNNNLSITKDLLFIVNVPQYYTISNRFAD